MRLLLLACLLALGLGGCDLTGGDTPPTIGTFAIHGDLQSNTCGYGGLAAPDSLDKTGIVGGYPGNAASFKWSDGSTTDGNASSLGIYSFVSTESTASSQVDATGQPLCNFTRTSQLTITITPTPVEPVDGGVADAGDVDASAADAGNVDAGNTGTYSLSGTYSESIVGTGSSCAAFLSTNGGTFDALPCRAAYTLTGTAPR